MDDFNMNVLSEAKNEYSSRLLNILTPLIIQGFKSILKEAEQLCLKNEEGQKYLMTFQNFLTRVPKWNQEIINIETQRIIETSKCSYLEDLLTCVHITQLKILTSIRVSNKQKKINIDIPKLNDFIHKVYIEAARKVYQNVYLFENGVMPLTIQKNMRECELLIQESILNIIRSSMPIEKILRSYIDETEEEEVFEETEDIPIKEEEETTNKDTAGVGETDPIDTDGTNNNPNTSDTAIIKKVDDQISTEANAETNTETNTETNAESATSGNTSITQDTNFKIITDTATKSTTDQTDSREGGNITFNNNDNIVNYKKDDMPGEIKNTASNIISAPKTIERLEKLSEQRYKEREEEEEEDADEEDEFKLKIHSDDNAVNLDAIDIHELSPPLELNNTDELGGVELLN